MKMENSKKIIGITFSSFDLLHAGHIRMLAEAREQCDYLIAGLQTDPTIDRPKKNKPTQTIVERYIQLHGCKFVDEIIPYTTEQDLEVVAKKISQTRIFEDASGKMNLSIHEIGGKILSISQFTLYASVKKGNRPSFTDAMTPDVAKKMYETFNDLLRQYDIEVLPGEFGAMMDIELVNDGPVTIIFESQDGKIK